MAPELVWDELPSRNAKRLRVLDPMAGSGTTLIMAKLSGHKAIGYDSDPLAVLLSRSSLTRVEPRDAESKALEVLKRARSRARQMRTASAYPRGADDETRAFVRRWFDRTNRVQLAALSDSISRMHDPHLRDVMWCAFSRLIITKSIGVSLARDISHSRPHLSYEKAPVNAFDRFERAVKRVVKSSPFSNTKANFPTGSMRFGDARNMPLRANSVDMVITSPPYLNAIDYIRGHKFSLIWMGHSLRKLRKVRGTNVGSETVTKKQEDDIPTERIMRKMCVVSNLSKRHAGMLRGYVRDMRAVLSETKRVLRQGKKAVFVVGNCNLRRTFVRNSRCIMSLAGEVGLVVRKTRIRRLPENRRYLPPPASRGAGKALKKRMRQEVILTLSKPS